MAEEELEEGGTNLHSGSLAQLPPPKEKGRGEREVRVRHASFLPSPLHFLFLVEALPSLLSSSSSSSLTPVLLSSDTK